MVNLQIACQDAGIPDSADFERWATAGLQQPQGELSIRVVSRPESQALNKQYRDKDKPTNVLSFPAAESAFPHLGDVVLGYAYCAAEAEAQGKTLSDHLSHLVVHGVLHLVGFDHGAPREAARMEGLERRVLAGLGVADPYAESLAG